MISFLLLLTFQIISQDVIGVIYKDNPLRRIKNRNDQVKFTIVDGRYIFQNSIINEQMTTEQSKLTKQILCADVALMLLSGI